MVKSEKTDSELASQLCYGGNVRDSKPQVFQFGVKLDKIQPPNGYGMHRYSIPIK